MSTGSLVPKTANEILKEVENSYKNEQKFTDEILLSLYSIYGEILTRALDLMDIGKFGVYQTPNGVRKVLKIKGKAEEYTLFPNVNFCSCLAFKYQVLQTRKFLTCKHILAGKLMEIAGKFTVETITPEQMGEVLKNLCPEDI